jgi:DNA-binding protein H-NS
MAAKKSGPTLAELNAQIAALQAQAHESRKKEVSEFVAKFKDAISHYGLTALNLSLTTGSRKNAKLPSAGSDQPASKRRKKAGTKPAARTVKFEDDNSNT